MAQGPLEVESSATLDLVGSNQFLSCPMAIFLLKVVPCPLPSCFTTKSKTGGRKDLLLAAGKNTRDLAQSSVSPNSKIEKVLSISVFLKGFD